MNAPELVEDGLDRGVALSFGGSGPLGPPEGGDHRVVEALDERPPEGIVGQDPDELEEAA